MFKTSLKILTLLSLIVLPQVTLLSSPAFDHQYREWGDLLRRYVKNELVDYPLLAKSPDLLNASVRTIETTWWEEYDHWSKNQKIVFWINAYNLSVVKLVIDYYPIRKHLSWKAFAYPEDSVQQIPNVWDRKVLKVSGNLKVFGEMISLNQIEHQILRKEFHDPRIHFALVCASLGCPVLREEPYIAEHLDAQLEDQIRRFLSDPKKVRYDAASNTLYLSPIFKWFHKDFEKSGGTIAFIKAHFPNPEGKKISQETKIKWLDYDWSLNEKR